MKHKGFYFMQVGNQNYSWVFFFKHFIILLIKRKNESILSNINRDTPYNTNADKIKSFKKIIITAYLLYLFKMVFESKINSFNNTITHIYQFSIVYGIRGYNIIYRYMYYLS